jgi:hypothetical protein
MCSIFVVISFLSEGGGIEGQIGQKWKKSEKQNCEKKEW